MFGKTFAITDIDFLEGFQAIDAKPWTDDIGLPNPLLTKLD